MKSKVFALSFGALKLTDGEERIVDVYTTTGAVTFAGEDLEVLRKVLSALPEVKRKPGRPPVKHSQKKSESASGVTGGTNDITSASGKKRGRRPRK